MQSDMPRNETLGGELNSAAVMYQQGVSLLTDNVDEQQFAGHLGWMKCVS